MCWLMNSNPVPIVCVKRPPLGLSGSLSALTVVPMSGAEDSVSFSLCAVATFDAPTNRRLLNHSAFATATAKSFLHGITTLRQRQSSPQFATPKTPASGSLFSCVGARSLLRKKPSRLQGLLHHQRSRGEYSQNSYEFAGLVDEVDAGDLPDLAGGLQDRIPKMGIPQK